MVVGKGLIAKAFDLYQKREDVIIFASGVSNSSISDNSSLFDRELELLNEYLNYKDKKFIYFSTCSLLDGSKQTPYINHKIKVEEIIKSRSNNYLIFRLPIVIGLSDNKNTFFNAIKNKIINKETITVQENISRYIIDVDDLSNNLPLFIDSKDNNKIINVCFDNREFVKNLIFIMEEYIGYSTQKIFQDMPKNLEIDNDYFLSKLKSTGYKFDENYNEKILKKYCCTEQLINK